MTALTLTIMILCCPDTLWARRECLVEQAAVAFRNDSPDKHELDSQIESIDREYSSQIKSFLSEPTGARLPKGKDPVLMLLIRFGREEDSAEQLESQAKKFLRSRDDVHALWVLDEIMGRDADLNREWSRTHDTCFALGLMDRLYEAQSSDRPCCFRYLFALLLSSDGLYAEYAWDKFIATLENKPLLIVQEFAVISPHRGSVGPTLEDVLPQEVLDMLIQKYKELPPCKNQKKAVEWLGSLTSTYGESW